MSLFDYITISLPRQVFFEGGRPGSGGSGRLWAGFAREFDSSIIKKTFAGRINPVLFLSIFSFLYMLFYVIV